MGSTSAPYTPATFFYSLIKSTPIPRVIACICWVFIILTPGISQAQSCTGNQKELRWYIGSIHTIVWYYSDNSLANCYDHLFRYGHPYEHEPSPGYTNGGCSGVRWDFNHSSQHAWLEDTTPDCGCDANKRGVVAGTCAPSAPPVAADPNLGSNCNAPATLDGNAVNVTTGNEFHTESDFDGSGLLNFRRYYNSQSVHVGALSLRWQHNFEKKLIIDEATALVVRPDGKVLEFTESGGSWSSTMESVATLEFFTSSSQYDPDYYLLTTANGTVEKYEANGRWASTSTPNGQTITAVYGSQGGENQVFKRIYDNFGHKIKFTYHPDSDLLKSVTIPGGDKYEFAYTAVDNILENVTTPDGTTRTYHYENPNFPRALTGITDEEGNRYATWEYDAQERVFEEFLGVHDDDGTYTDEIEYRKFVYGTNQTTVTNPLGKDTIYHFSTIAGKNRITDVDGVASANCGAADGDTSYQHYPSTGLVRYKTDSRGNITEYHHNARGLEDWRIEAQGTLEERTIYTKWHDDFNLPEIITETGRKITYGYDGTTGELVSKTIEDTTSHNSPDQVWGYDFDQGRLKYIDGPLDGTVDKEFYDYDATTGFLTKYTNALGHETDVTLHNDWGLPKRVEDPNGIITDLDYTDRGWLKSTSTVAGLITRTTLFTYYNNGLLKTVTLPNNVVYTYTYDTAQRLKQIDDSQGQAIKYGLDTAGNRTSEKILKAGGSEAYTSSRVYDELSRLIWDVDYTGQYERYERDPNGNAFEDYDRKLQKTTNTFDALNRLAAIEYADTGYAQFIYNELDQITSVIDQNTHTTTYDYDGLGNLRILTSPDTGTTVFNTYDEAGNLTKKTDAKGGVTEYEYDALGRLEKIKYPAHSSRNVTFSYDHTFLSKGIGRLSTIADASGGTVFLYDGFGRVWLKQVAMNNVVYQWIFGYNAAGNLTDTTFPDGRQVEYSYDANGEVSEVRTREYTSGTTYGPDVILADTFDYLPFGPIKSWEFGNGIEHAVTYDKAYRVDTIVDADTFDVLNLDFDYDDNHNVDDITNGVSSTLNQDFDYDVVDRLDTAAGVYGSYNYDYDVAGNRTLFSKPNYSETFNKDLSSNQLDSIDVDDNGSPTTHTFIHDANGNITSGKGYYYFYNYPDNRMDAGGSTSMAAFFGYNALGQRVAIAGGDGMHRHYHYDLNGDLYMESDADTGVIVKQYIRVEGQLLAVIGPKSGSSSPIYYSHSDHLGTPQKLTNQIGTVVWKADYDPFGIATVNSDPDGDSNHIEFNLRFPGQYYDKYTGANYNYYRDYDPTTGRYLQSDPIGLQGGLNTYAYVGGNPVTRYDSYGLCVWDFCVLEGIAAVEVAAWVGVGAIALYATYDALFNETDEDDQCQPSDDERQEKPPGYWPGDKGASEWGRRDGVGSKEGKRRFHQGVKGRDPMSGATDDYSTNPDTGDVIDPAGDYAGNLNDDYN